MIDEAALTRIAELEAQVDIMRAQLDAVRAEHVRAVGELTRERESKAAYCAAYHRVERDHRALCDDLHKRDEVARRKAPRVT